MIAHRYLFALSVLLFASSGQVFAQSSAESRVDKLEDTVRTLERRVATLEDQLRQRNAAPSIPPDKANWRRLQKGLSEADVERLLGSPTKVNANLAFTTWEYGDSDGGYVQFDAKSRTVMGWYEP
ncbi:hypothetical protein [Pseudomonas fluorescens]|uniref:hypothetical protein n=1 Tax=Pseudomonas fluorescens TaxID=294 RepID=UPI00163AFA3B|nr:hypothetical protein [Pseudomonas fluorescens]